MECIGSVENLGERHQCISNAIRGITVILVAITFSRTVHHKLQLSTRKMMALFRHFVNVTAVLSLGPVQFQDHGQPGWGLPTQPVFSRSREGSTEGENENAGRQTQELVRSGNRRKESHQSNTQPPQAFPEYLDLGLSAKGPSVLC
ncbi:hypothetical protein RRG08_003116 [Elysia crispata]|uniref:Uncharacterized protein n=1 Tax=Elysia crispata TaxID=231223 RepID=A0AAE1B7M4_9GAST|nr:hypothetical protein RRG08_003116 [Elysia crispata]